MLSPWDSLLAAAQSGAEWASDRISKELAPRVRGYLVSLGADDPDDLLGEVWLQVARNIGSFTGDEAGFRSWVFMIAHHRAIDEYRRRTRRPRRPRTTSYEMTGPGPLNPPKSPLWRRSRRAKCSGCWISSQINSETCSPYVGSVTSRSTRLQRSSGKDPERSRRCNAGHCERSKEKLNGAYPYESFCR